MKVTVIYQNHTFGRIIVYQLLHRRKAFTPQSCIRNFLHDFSQLCHSAGDLMIPVHFQQNPHNFWCSCTYWKCTKNIKHKENMKFLQHSAMRVIIKLNLCLQISFILVSSVYQNFRDYIEHKSSAFQLSNRKQILLHDKYTSPCHFLVLKGQVDQETHM